MMDILQIYFEKTGCILSFTCFSKMENPASLMIFTAAHHIPCGITLPELVRI